MRAMRRRVAESSGTISRELGSPKRDAVLRSNGRQSVAEAAKAMSPMESASLSERPPKVRGSCMIRLESCSKSGYCLKFGVVEGGNSMNGGKTLLISVRAMVEASLR